MGWWALVLKFQVELATSSIWACYSEEPLWLSLAGPCMSPSHLETGLLVLL